MKSPTTLSPGRAPRSPGRSDSSNRFADSGRSTLLLLALLWLLTGSASGASTLHVSPVRIFLDVEKTIESLRFQNPTDDAVMVQADLKRWSQADGRDRYEPSDDLIVAPRQFRIPPGGEQIVRLGLRDRPTGKREATYRVFFSEIPDESELATGIQFALRLSLPIFVHPDEPTAPRVDARLERGDDGDRLVLTNPLDHHVRLIDWSLVDLSSDEPEVVQSWERKGAYLLARSTLDVPLGVDLSAVDLTRLELRARASRGELATPVRSD